jgi:hypothetical protein
MNRIAFDAADGSLEFFWITTLFISFRIPFLQRLHDLLFHPLAEIKAYRKSRGNVPYRKSLMKAFFFPRSAPDTALNMWPFLLQN